jgi:hypothetical protein
MFKDLPLVVTILQPYLWLEKGLFMYLEANVALEVLMNTSMMFTGTYVHVLFVPGRLHYFLFVLAHWGTIFFEKHIDFFLICRFDLDTNNWERIEAQEDEDNLLGNNRKTRRPHPRSQSFIFVWEGCLYVYGGYDGHSVLADMYKLDLNTRTWSYVWASKFYDGCGGSPVGVAGLRPVDFRIHPCRPAALIVCNKLLVLSEDYENGTALLFSLDLKTFRWHRMASVRLKTNTRPTSLSSLGPPARGNPTMSLTRDSQLLIIGGHNRNESRFPDLRQNHGQLGHVWAFKLPRRMDWARQRILWIACLKNRQENGCHFARCPPHLIYYIIGLVNSDTFR